MNNETRDKIREVNLVCTFSPLSLPTTLISNPTQAPSGARGISSYVRNCIALGSYR